MRSMIILIVLLGCGDMDRRQYPLCDFSGGPLCYRGNLCVNDNTEDGSHCYPQCDPHAEKNLCLDHEDCRLLLFNGFPTEFGACMPKPSVDGGVTKGLRNEKSSASTRSRR